MSTVYRVENQNGEGPYTWFPDFPSEVEDMKFRHDNMTKWPNPFNDNGIRRSPKSNEHCGFESLEQLDKWFSDDIDMLRENGYEIVKFEDVEITVHGEKQVLFRKPCLVEG